MAQSSALSPSLLVTLMSAFFDIKRRVSSTPSVAAAKNKGVSPARRSGGLGFGLGSLC